MVLILADRKTWKYVNGKKKPKPNQEQAQMW